MHLFEASPTKLLIQEGIATRRKNGSRLNKNKQFNKPVKIVLVSYGQSSIVKLVILKHDKTLLTVGRLDLL